MKKEDLIALGLNEEQIKTVFKLNGIAVENVRTQMAEVETKVSELEQVKLDLEGKLANQVNSEDLSALEQAKVDLENKLAEKDVEIAGLMESNQKEIDKITYDNLLVNALKGAGAKSIRMAKAVLDTDAIKLVDGKLEGIDAEIARLTTDDKLKHNFGTEEINSGKPVFTKKRQDSGPTATKESIMSIKDSSERIKAIQANVHLFD